MRNRTVGINVRVTPAEKHPDGIRRPALRSDAVGISPAAVTGVHARSFTPPVSLFSALEELDALADRLPPGDALPCRTATDQIRDALLPKE